MTEQNPPSRLPKAVSAPAMPALLYPWPQGALNVGLPWVWPNETASDLNKLEPFIAERMANALITARAEWEAGESERVAVARREGREAGLREALGVLVACSSSEDAFGLDGAIAVAESELARKGGV